MYRQYDFPGTSLGVKPRQVANPHNSFCIEQRAAEKSKEEQVRVFGLLLLLPRLAPVGLIVRLIFSKLFEVLVRLSRPFLSSFQMADGLPVLGGFGAEKTSRAS